MNIITILGANIYVRPELPKDPRDYNVDQSTKKSPSNDLRALQFNFHRSAFDVNMEDLEEHPWRLPHTDISDYFNYGFNETTWLVRLFF